MRRYSLEGLGERVREARKAKKAPATGRAMSQGELAAAVGVSLNTISEMERGRIPRDPNLIIRIADVLGVGDEWLMGSPDQPSMGEVEEARRIVAAAERGPAGPAGPAAPAPPAATPVDPALASDPRYWKGRTDELLNTWEYLGSSLRHTTAMYERALESQREISANTLPVPRDQVETALTDQEREFLALMRKGGDEMRARLEREAREALEKQTPPRGKQGRRASGE